MKKLVICLFTALLFVSFSVHAQDCTFYFPTKVGTNLEMKTYDGKDKLKSSVKSKVLESTANSVKFNSEIFDEKGKSLSKGDYEVKCQNGEFVIDMKSYLKDMDMSKYKDMQLDMSATNMSIPKNLQVGQKLNDGEISIKISSGGFKIMTISVKMLNRTVVGFEDVTTPAGTFKCAKITSDMESKMMVTVKMKLTEWLSEKTGVVRSESRDQKDKLQTYTVLSALN